MTFHYNDTPYQNTPPAYIQQAVAANAWYDPNRTWEEWWSGKKKDADNLPYDHAFPYGHDAKDASKPYAPFGFEGGRPVVDPDQKELLKSELAAHKDPSDPESPLNPSNVDSPMDPSNTKEFFDRNKPGSSYHVYERIIDIASSDEDQTRVMKMVPPSDGWTAFNAKDTPENFPWAYDQDSSHHYRKIPWSASCMMTWPEIKPTSVNLEIATDTAVAPIGWTQVDSNPTYSRDCIKFMPGDKAVDSSEKPAGWTENINEAYQGQNSGRN